MRWHSSSTASALESNCWRSEPSTVSIAAWVSPWAAACSSVSRNRLSTCGTSACVITGGSSSISARHLARGQLLVALDQLGDQAVDARRADLLREAALVGLHQPGAQHVDVVY